MRLFLLTALAMSAFAANSVLNRMAVAGGKIDPIDFAVVRLIAGAGMLACVMGLRSLRGGALWAGWQGRGAGVFGLLVYLFAFSAAYQSLDAGVGALILFGAVQVTMFAGAVIAKDDLPLQRWLGAGLAFLGLVVLMAPGSGSVPSLSAGATMAIAGVGWGFYSLAGRRADDALASTAWNFLLSVPVMVLVLWLGPSFGGVPVSAQAQGIWLAIISGAITSGLGYALWYTLVPGLGASRAGVAQLTVPLIAAAGGAFLIGESVGLRFAIAAAMVLGGVGFASLQSGFFKR